MERVIPQVSQCFRACLSNNAELRLTGWRYLTTRTVERLRDYARRKIDSHVSADNILSLFEV